MHEFRARIGQKSLALAWEMAIDNVADNRLENGIAEKFEPFVIDGLSFVVALRRTAVEKGRFVIVDMVWVEAQYLVKTRIKLLILAERELYTRYQMTNLHIS